MVRLCSPQVANPNLKSKIANRKSQIGNGSTPLTTGRKSQIPNPKSQIANPKSAMVRLRSPQVANPKSQIPNRQWFDSLTTGRKSQIANPKSQIPNRKSQIVYLALPMDAFLSRAHKLLQQNILVDGHIDFPWQAELLYEWSGGRYDQIPVRSNKGDFDIERAKAGGLSAAFMAIYIASSFQDDLATAKSQADTLIDMVKGMIQSHPDLVAAGDSPEMIESNFSHGLISLPMGLENGAPLMTLYDIQYFYDRGIRYVTLTHAKDNHICDSSYDESRTWKGLSTYGREVVAEMNRVGMIVDVSHISDDAFYQVMELSAAPVLATHSSCRHFTPGWERNMDDKMISLLAEKDGVIQINFGSDFLHSDIAAARKARKAERDNFLKHKSHSKGDTGVEYLKAAFDRDHPDIYADVAQVADHIDHVRKIAGIDFIGIGSDFDGVGDSLPVGLKDVSQYPHLFAELLRRDYSDEDISKICYRNVWRVWNKVNEVAKSI